MQTTLRVAPPLACGALSLALLAALSAQLDSQSTYLSHARARPVFEALGEPVPAVNEWPRWIAAADAAARARVTAGDEMSVVNLFHLYPFPTGASRTSDSRIFSFGNGENYIVGGHWFAIMPNQFRSQSEVVS